MHIILTGATGLVGSAVLDALIKNKAVTQISIISRRPVKMADDARDSRIRVIIHKDFEKYDEELLSQLKNAKGCVWALGISQNLVGKEEYVRITKDYALAAARAFQNLPPENEPFNFVYVSGGGTTLQPGRFTPLFARVKGETELALSEMRTANPLFHAMSMRPYFIDYIAHDAIKPYIPNQGLIRSTAMAAIGPIIRAGVKSQWSPTIPLGQFLVELAAGGYRNQLQGDGIEKLAGFAIIDNLAFRRLVGLDKHA